MSQEEIVRYQSLAREAIAHFHPYPEGRFAGRGVVICGGGAKYFPCAYVCINMLRHAGCRLPVELWHLGPLEMNGTMRELVAPLGVTCVDGHEIHKEHPVRRLSGWELKPYSILHSRFEEVLFLDADNVPLIDPEVFFDCEEYLRTGALFWPDFHPVEKKNQIWAVTEVEYRFEPSFESGQIVVDKRRCWAELQLTMHYNEHSDFYYGLTGGDKDTFHFAWLRLSRAYGMIPHHVRALSSSVMNQHDFAGEVVFHHRNNAKWMLDVPANRRISGFREEERCLGFLRDLAARWNGDPARLPPDSPAARRLHDEVAATERYVYHRIGHDRRILRLRADQGIEGAGSLETSWFVRTREDGVPVLCVAGGSHLTCEAEPRGDGGLTGRWQVFERMPIELIPLSSIPVEEQLELAREAYHAALCGSPAFLVRVRHERQLVCFRPDGQIVADKSGKSAGTWRFCCHHGEVVLELVEPHGGHHYLYEEPDGIFREARATGRERMEVISLRGVRLD